MNVLDPFEVAEICVWPLDLSKVPEAEKRACLDRAEYTLFQKVISESKLGAVLNEKPPLQSKTIQLPPCHRRRIIPDSIYPQRKHPDVRIARRASTIASLARVISERDVSPGLRRTLLTQARRLERLAAERLQDFPVQRNTLTLRGFAFRFRLSDEKAGDHHSGLPVLCHGRDGVWYRPPSRTDMGSHAPAGQLRSLRVATLCGYGCSQRRAVHLRLRPGKPAAGVSGDFAFQSHLFVFPESCPSCRPGIASLVSFD